MVDDSPEAMRERLGVMDTTGTDAEAVLWALRHGSKRDEWEIDTGHWHNAVGNFADERDAALARVAELEGAKRWLCKDLHTMSGIIKCPGCDEQVWNPPAQRHCGGCPECMGGGNE